MTQIIFELSEADRLNNHIPEVVWELSRNNKVFIRNHKTGELVLIIDCCYAHKGGESMSSKVTVEFVGSKSENAVGMFMEWLIKNGFKSFNKECYQHDITLGKTSENLEIGYILQEVD